MNEVERVVVGPKNFWAYDDKVGKHRPYTPGERVRVSPNTASVFRSFLKDPKVAEAEAQVAAAEAKALNPAIEEDVAPTPAPTPTSGKSVGSKGAGGS